MSFDNNNDNNNEKENKRSVYRFLDKQGFYLILLLCVSIVLVTAMWVSRQEEEYHLSEAPPENLEEDFSRVEITLVEEDTSTEEDSQEAAKIGDSNNIVVSEPVEKPTAEESDTQAAAVEEVTQPKQEPQLEVSPKRQPAAEKDNTPTTAAQDIIMIQPVIGKVGLPFAEDRLVYHETLEHWSIHSGMDIHGEEGAPVRAVLDGEVIEVVNDTIMGITISLQHEEDLITRYSNLSTDAMVKVGQKVTKGQVISGIGRTAANKTLEGPLLHFQVLKEGRAVDPQNYLPKIN
ncbi:Murein DD-endopeptidase MepM and murein hydrolase activator NlpD, contain LysM domain [Natronincola peptidivorans]|uniref:Murein DD-endopeptidase MepM and murein hydrolase activator NlpD, contain LysM domain n=1 Tax=Natronincola peptidivorans TaxID=426128 RepID=A0A1H9ZPL6_9FIRM|nr:M23 family metallopeptidase [Natronincola peptidivorans]SES83613.1 Murein DD-endopeptidase MepM and murein hydrolase activator NlpD, contain LysM domain [Natronincola peptidivorans]